MTPIIIGWATPEHAVQMGKIADFCNVSQIRYVDNGNGEDYILTKEDGTELELRIRGNRADGAFLCVK